MQKKTQKYRLTLIYNKTENNNLQILSQKLEQILLKKGIQVSNFVQGDPKIGVGTLLDCDCIVEQAKFTDDDHLKSEIEKLLEPENILSKKMKDTRITLKKVKTSIEKKDHDEEKKINADDSKPQKQKPPQKQPLKQKEKKDSSSSSCNDSEEECSTKQQTIVQKKECKKKEEPSSSDLRKVKEANQSLVDQQKRNSKSIEKSYFDQAGDDLNDSEEEQIPIDSQEKQVQKQNLPNTLLKYTTKKQ